MASPDDTPPDGGASDAGGHGLQRWPHTRSEQGPDLHVCRVRFDWLTNPRNGQLLRRTVLETPDWVNVVALDAQRRLIVVQQFRFGSADFTTEIPGGMVDAGESHADAARRELREEAGYTSARWTYLGCVQPNPAFQNNLCHHWLAEDAQRSHAQELDGGEDIAIDALTLEQVRAAIRDGTMRHALVLTALTRVFDLRPFEGPALGSA